MTSDDVLRSLYCGEDFLEPNRNLDEPTDDGKHRQHSQRNRHHRGRFVRMLVAAILAEEGQEHGAKHIERGEPAVIAPTQYIHGACW